MQCGKKVRKSSSLWKDSISQVHVLTVIFSNLPVQTSMTGERLKLLDAIGFKWSVSKNVDTKKK